MFKLYYQMADVLMLLNRTLLKPLQEMVGLSLLLERCVHFVFLSTLKIIHYKSSKHFEKKTLPLQK